MDIDSLMFLLVSEGNASPALNGSGDLSVGLVAQLGRSVLDEVER